MLRKIYIAVLLVAVGTLIGIYILRRTTPAVNTTGSPSPTANQIQTIKLLIDSGDGNPLSFTLPFSVSSTPFSLLNDTVQTNNWEISTRQYDFGIFVQSLLGKPSTADMSWIYFINGKSGSVAADKALLQPADVVEWKYTKPF